jgi:hypothetical protein
VGFVTTGGWLISVKVEWGARANLVKDEGRWKMKFYQVYLVSWTFGDEVRR